MYLIPDGRFVLSGTHQWYPNSWRMREQRPCFQLKCADVNLQIPVNSHLRISVETTPRGFSHHRPPTLRWFNKCLKPTSVSESVHDCFKIIPVVND